MTIRDWILIVFTILAQMSVGAFLCYGAVYYFAKRKAGAEEADKLSNRSLAGIAVAVVLAMIVSLFHLGNPMNAYRAVTNVGTSWLSREILSTVLFTGFTILYAILHWRKIGGSTLRSVLGWLAALSGLFLVWSMSHVYMLPSQPVWNTPATIVSFYATTLLLGALAMGTGFVANYAYLKGKAGEETATQQELLKGSLRWIALASIILLGVQLVTLPLQVAQLVSGGGAAQEGARLMFGTYGVVLFLRLALVFLGAGVLGLFLFQNASQAGKESALKTLAYSAFALVLVAEVLGRFLFYATHVKIGI